MCDYCNCMSAWEEQFSPERERMVDIAMRHTDKPCIGEPCDLDAPCKRHSRTTRLVNRLFPTTKRGKHET